ncbi:Mss4-like protein, partial [Talaromyces proteolyticus]
MSTTAQPPEPHIPSAGPAENEDEVTATATCFCGAPTQGPGLVNTFLCHCKDCHKITASMFSSCFTIANSHLKHIRGRENLRTFQRSHTIASGHTVTNNFCATCGSLMYRVSSGHPGISVLRIGTVDDFHLHESKLRPQVEVFTQSRVSWLHSL